MSEIHDVIQRIRSSRTCRLLASLGIPKVSTGEVLPEGVEEFFTVCGGAELHLGKTYPFTIGSPAGFAPANLAILGEDAPDDISAHWYVITGDGGRQHISIDTGPERSGRCFDSFDDVHAVAGESPIIATSFADLLSTLLDAEGGRLPWLEDTWSSLGDAGCRSTAIRLSGGSPRLR